MQACGWAAVLASGVVAPCLAQTSQAGAPLKWGPHIDLEGKLGNNRDLGEADVFVPLLQDGTSLFFGNLKGRLDDNASREGNFGLGLRHMLDAGWNLGAYGYYDRRRTETHNWFSQATFGLEALSLDWDLRANTYLPLGRRTHDLGSSSGGASTAALSGTTVQVTTPGASVREERSLTGFDAEIGWRVPVFDVDAGRALRIYGGAYRFYADDVNPVQGPRGRVELVFDQVPGLWDGARLALGGEVQHDGPRGTTGFASARLRIPLQLFGGNPLQLTAIERRMADPVVRDIDIVAQSRTVSTPSTVETATQTSGGSNLTVLTTDTSANGNLSDELTTAGANATVIISGTINTTSQTTVLAGQTLTGSGTLTVRTASGKTASVSLSGGTISGSANVLAMSGAGSTLSGMTITQSIAGAATGITVSANVTISSSTITITSTGGNATGISGTSGSSTISNNTISVTGSGNGTGLAFSGGSTATLSNNTITTVAGGGNTARAVNVTNSTATVSGNTLSASGGGVNRHTYLDTATINAGSTGNTVSAGSCEVANAGAGSAITYTNAANCGP